MVIALRNQLSWVAVAGAALVMAGCTVKDQAIPPLTGPSEAALSVTVTASPDSILQDGASQSAISVLVRDANARPVSGQPLRVDMAVGGTVQDFGTLAARTIVTGSDGRAATTYTAPAMPSGSLGGSGTRVQIVVTPTGTNFATSSSQTVDIRLTPPGVILPPAETPTAQFQFTAQQPASSPVTGVPVIFDASSSCGGPLSGGQCTSGSAITSFKWNFGDASGGGTGVTATHVFANSGSFPVTLTVTNDRGASASATQTVVVAQSAAPTAAFAISPQNPTVNTAVFFNAGTSVAGAGRTITTYTWDFGDGSPRGNGVAVSHTYAAANTYIVVLQVTDDLGRTATQTAQVQVK